MRIIQHIMMTREEDWSRSNVESAAWMSRYILWEKPSLTKAIENANKMYKDIKFQLK